MRTSICYNIRMATRTSIPPVSPVTSATTVTPAGPEATGTLFPPTPDTPYETMLRRRQYSVVAGLDEVGRGCIAGPVVAAAVVLRSLRPRFVTDIDDSKKLSAAERTRLDRLIRRHAVAVGVGVVDNTVVDDINILQASFQAMRLALDALSVQPDYLLIDGHLPLPLTELPQLPLVKGDSRCKSIGAASIVAKVYRDGLMARMATEYPHYGFTTNKGYGTPEHWRALREHGPTPLHRMSFKGVGTADPEAFSHMDLEPA